MGDFFTNHYDEHIQDLRAALQRKRDALGGALRESFGPNVEFEMPRGRHVSVAEVPRRC